MILRPRQAEFVSNCVDHLHKHGNALGVAVTGFGKTIALAGICDQIFKTHRGSRAMIMAHRDELTAQNMDKFQNVCSASISRFDRFEKNQEGRATFGMVQTMARRTKILKPVDILVIDEAHHAAANSYQKVISHYRSVNPSTMILGLTATPDRADKAGLGNTFSQVADVVGLKEMVDAGYLVPPVGYVIDIGTQDELNAVKKSGDDFDQKEIEIIQNTPKLNDQIIDNWAEKAGDRQTVLFSATIEHAEDVAAAFRNRGYRFEAIHSKLPSEKRKWLLSALASGEIQGLVNPMILTEGWDCPVVSCIGLLRVSSHKSTVIQMVGRGLRKVDPVTHPGVIKNDCVVLDFGVSLIIHGNLDTDENLSEKPPPGAPKEKECPICHASIPIQVRTCPICGHDFIPQPKDLDFSNAKDFRLIEIDLIGNSPFRWFDLWGDGAVLVSCGFNSWATVTSANGQDYFAFGGIKGEGKTKYRTAPIGVGNKVQALASADDHMRTYEKNRAAKKRAAWMDHPWSDSQRNQLMGYEYDPGLPLTKSEAAAHMTFCFNRHRIEQFMGVSA